MDYLEMIRKVERDLESKPDWHGAWREVASLTLGISRDDPRYGSLTLALARCDDAFLAGDWAGFQRAAAQMKAIVDGKLV